MPKPLIVARYFAKEQAEIDHATADLEALQATQTELEEEHGGEDGAFAELEKITAISVKARIKELRSVRSEESDRSEEAALQEWLDLNTEIADLKSTIRDAESALDTAAYAKYAALTEDEIKKLVVDDKWLATLGTAIHGEIDRIEQALTGRVKELAERYAAPLPAMTERVAELEIKVSAHLAKMGFH